MLISAQVLTNKGDIITLTKEHFHFTNRMSDLKRGKLNGIILRVSLRKEFGNVIELKEKAENNHQLRLTTQPGPKDNLGSTYCYFGSRTLYGKILGIISKTYALVLRLLGHDKKCIAKKKYELEFRLMGGSEVLPYLFYIHRFHWKDENADKIFLKYQVILQKIYKYPQLEIEIRN